MRQSLRTKLRRCLRLVAAIFPLVGAVGCASPTVNVQERINVGDAELYAEIRGVDPQAPMMIWLHGGPGGAERPLFRFFNSDLEKSFLVTYLDQRGAGRSYDPEASTSRLTIARHVQDLDVVVDRLRRDFRRQRVLLVGHSWGTVLGALYAKAHPEKVSGLISIAPVVSVREQQLREYAFDLSEARKTKDQKVLRELAEIGPPPYPTSEQVLRLQRLTERYHGVAFKEHDKVLIVAAGLLGGLVTPWELSRIFQGNSISLSAMHRELDEFDMRNEVRELSVPVFYFLGRHDHHVDAELAREYFETLCAPTKELVWFERSAHEIPFDESEAVNAKIVALSDSLARD